MGIGSESFMSYVLNDQASSGGSLVFVDGDIQSVFLRRLAQSIVSLA